MATLVQPSLLFESALWDAGLRRVAGIDEVGIGPICGPVVAAAVVLPPRCAMLDDVRDSKTLLAAQRERLFPLILDRAVAVGVGAASVSEIERLNVLQAAHLAMGRALRRIGATDHALVDGRPVRGCYLGPHTAIVDGDALCYSIACASIVAKVMRDHLMAKLSQRYPSYGWESNAGYGTPAHLRALRSNGLTPYHRRSFAPVRDYLIGTKETSEDRIS